MITLRHKEFFSHGVTVFFTSFWTVEDRWDGQHGYNGLIQRYLYEGKSPIDEYTHFAHETKASPVHKTLYSSIYVTTPKIYRHDEIIRTTISEVHPSPSAVINICAIAGSIGNSTVYNTNQTERLINHKRKEVKKGQEQAEDAHKHTQRERVGY